MPDFLPMVGPWLPHMPPFRSPQAKIYSVAAKKSCQERGRDYGLLTPSLLLLIIFMSLRCSMTVISMFLSVYLGAELAVEKASFHGTDTHSYVRSLVMSLVPRAL